MLNLSALTLTIPLVTGLLLGYVLRGRKKVGLSRAMIGAIVVLIFSLGFSIGSNNELLESMPRVGLSALVIAVLAIGFSVLFAVLARRRLRIE